METQGQFKGFSRELIDFLFELKFNNTVGALLENKLKYKELITQPLTLLHGDLIPVVLSVDGCFDCKPSRCISSPYRDRRFSHDAPMKDYMYLRYKISGSDSNAAGLYFDMGIEYYSFGIRVYDQTAKGMEQLRKKVLERPDAFENVLQGLSAVGFAIYAKSYKKDHFPETTQPSAKELLNCSSFYIGQRHDISDAVFSDRLAAILAQGFLDMKPMIKLL